MPSSNLVLASMSSKSSAKNESNASSLWNRALICCLYASNCFFALSMAYRSWTCAVRLAYFSLMSAIFSSLLPTICNSFASSSRRLSISIFSELSRIICSVAADSDILASRFLLYSSSKSALCLTYFALIRFTSAPVRSASSNSASCCLSSCSCLMRYSS